MAGLSVRIRRSAARELDALEPRAVRRRLVARIASLAAEPRPPGVEKLAGGGSRWRLRQGPYPVLYEIDAAERRVVVVRIGRRRDVYREGACSIPRRPRPGSGRNEPELENSSSSDEISR